MNREFTNVNGLSEARLDLLAKVAVLYYEDDMDQMEIAKRIGKSRSMVSKMLLEVRKLKMVEFRVDFPLRRDEELERRLCFKYGLEQAWVLNTTASQNDESLTRMVGKLGARCLQSRLFDGICVGISAGSTVLEVVRAMPRIDFQESTVVQLIGAISDGSNPVDSAQLVKALALKMSASCRSIPAPLMVNSRAAAKSLLNQKTIKDTLEFAETVDVALIGIGDVDSNSSNHVTRDYIGQSDLAKLKRRGAVGEVVAHFLDIHGEPIELGTFQAIGINLKELHSIPSVIGVAAGVGKAKAVVSALKGGYINVLITDAYTAAQVVKIGDELDTASYMVGNERGEGEEIDE